MIKGIIESIITSEKFVQIVVDTIIDIATRFGIDQQLIETISEQFCKYDGTAS